MNRLGLILILVTVGRLRPDNGRCLYLQCKVGTNQSESGLTSEKQLVHDLFLCVTGKDAEKLSTLIADDFTLRVFPA
jgi:hypothetical protein